MQQETDFFDNLPEPNKSCFLALCKLIKEKDSNITMGWSWGMPFFKYKGKMLCYIWTDKKTKQPYIGIADGYKINHTMLVQANRKRIKVFYVNPLADIDIETINEILDYTIDLQNNKT